MAEVEEKRK